MATTESQPTQARPTAGTYSYVAPSDNLPPHGACDAMETPPRVTGTDGKPVD